MLFRPCLRVLVFISLFALPAFAGSYRWTIKGPDGGNVGKLAFDPGDPSIAYAATDNGIFRSSNGGQSWVGSVELLGTSVMDVAVANSDPQTVFASTSYGLYKSSDRGVTWTTVHNFGSYKVAVARQNANVVYSLSTSGPIRSSDGGVTFGNTGSGLPAVNSVSALVIDPQNADTVYVSYLLSSAGVYKSVDGGANWTSAGRGLPPLQYFSLVIDPSNASTLYVGAGGGIYRSTDGAASWTALQTTLSDAFYYSLSISAATSPSTLVAGTSRGLIKSTTGGSTWTPRLFVGEQGVNAVAIDPLNAQNLFALASFNLFRSTNGGTNFVNASSGLTAFYTQAIAADLRNGAVYAAGPAGIFKSTDRGETWSSAGPLATYFAVDPFNSLTLYAISSGAFRRSVDGGVVWQDFRTGLPASSAIVIATDPQVPGTLYTIVGNAVYRKVGNDPWAIRNTGLPANGFPAFISIDPQNSSMLYTGGGFGLFKSADGGANWVAANAGMTGVNVSGIAIDPFDSNHLLTSSTSPMYESMNGGTSWAPQATAQSGVLVFDPNERGRIYTSTFTEVRLSVDGGKTWLPLSNGLGRTHGNIFVIAPGGRTLYSGGSGGGVWAFTFDRRRAVSR